MTDRVTRLLLAASVLAAALGLLALAARFPCVAAVAVALAVGRRARAGRRPAADAYGTARWCSAEDARKAGLL